jgi:hypothetical protein
MKKLVRIVVVIYIVVGVLLWLVHPRLTDAERLAVKTCDQIGIVPTVVMWPLYVNYYYGSGRVFS